MRLTFLFLLLLLLMACQRTAASLPSPTPPPLVRQTPGAASYTALESLHTAEAPPRDLIALTEQFKLGGAPISPTPAPTAAGAGHTADFWVKMGDDDRNESITAELRYQSAQLELWVATAAEIDEAELTTAAQTLEQEILPTTTRLFGQPDRLPVSILHVPTLGGGTIGYFSAADGYPTAVNPFSNQRNLLYIALEYAPLDSVDYYAVVAHELQHMVHEAQDSNEETWLNEGLSELAAHLNGYPADNHTAAFLAAPDNSLTHFNYESGDYGAAYLFVRYLYERFGAEFIRDLVAEQANGAKGITAVLPPTSPSFDELVAGWQLANALAIPATAEHTSPAIPVYALGEMSPVEATAVAAGQNGRTAIHQYAADYYHLTSESPLALIFTGTLQTPLLPTTPASGDTFWTTLPADSSASHLTRAFDLTAVDSPTATLHFRTWYDIELGWDYGYLAVSADGGTSWATLATLATSTANPQGNNLGAGYTGTSGSREPAAWVEQAADLTPYLGQAILVRFLYVTDDAQLGAGWALDDFRLPALGWADDTEASGGDDGWTAVGFVRHSNNLPQTFVAQILYLHGDGSLTAENLPLDGENSGRWLLPLSPATPEAIVIFSATTPFTAVPATYEWAIQQE